MRTDHAFPLITIAAIVGQMKREYDFPADTSVLEKIAEIVTKIVNDIDFSDAEIGDITLALDEACSNTILHGLKSDPNKTFQLVIEAGENEVVFLIIEKGEPFDPAKVKIPDVNASLEDRNIGGLGFYFIQELMDEVEYKTSEDGVKTLRMLKRKAKGVS